jgi:anti-sigma factor RsiW
MTHLFSEEEWNDYIEGEVDDETRDRFEAHLIGCLSCWKFNQRMANATQALRVSGAGMRAVFALQDRQLSAGMRAVFAKIEEAESAKRDRPRRLIQQRLDALAAVMAPMCGSQTANKALRAAAQVSPARSLERVTEDNWTSFLASLKPIANVMCGETGARLVWESGQF